MTTENDDLVKRLREMLADAGLLSKDGTYAQGATRDFEAVFDRLSAQGEPVAVSDDGVCLTECGELVRLDDCPPGLFLFNETLCFRSEYRTSTARNKAQPDAYVVESGEYFWGGATNSIDRNDLLVQPMDAKVRQPADQPSVAPVAWKDAARELREHQTQLDMDGVMVGVSRQALGVILSTIDGGDL